MLAHPAPPAAQPDEAVLVAAVDQLLDAGAAVAVPDGGLHAHAVAFFDVRDRRADFFHDAGELVAQRQGEGFVGDGVGTASFGDQVGAAEIFVLF